MTIHEIADALNFPTDSFFCRYFKHETGCSPSEYRQSEQNTNKAIKPADETEVIADVIIRESEIAAMD